MLARLVCGNGAIGVDNAFSYKMKHRSTINARFENVHDDISLWDTGFNESIEQYKQLAAQDVKSSLNLTRYFTDVMDFKPHMNQKTGMEELHTKQKNTLIKLQDYFDDKVHNIGHNWFTAFQAVTAFTNHIQGRGVETALDSLWYGQAARRQTFALEKAIEFSQSI